MVWFLQSKLIVPKEKVVNLSNISNHEITTFKLRTIQSRKILSFWDTLHLQTLGNIFVNAFFHAYVRFGRLVLPGKDGKEDWCLGITDSTVGMTLLCLE